MLYQNIIKPALKVTVRHKKLWFFGFVASFLGSSGVLEVILENLSQIFQQKQIYWSVMAFFDRYPLADWLANFNKLFIAEPGNMAYLLGVFIVLVLLALAFFYFSISARNTLLLASRELRDKRPIIYSKIWPKAAKAFLPVFGLVILFSLITFLLVSSFGFLITETFSLANFFVDLLLLIVLIFLLFFVSLSLMLSNIGVVVNQEKFWPAIKKSIILIKHNFVKSLQASLWVFFVEIIILFAFLGVLTFVLLLFYLLSVFLYELGLFFLVTFLFYLMLLLLFCMYFFLMGISATFQFSAWYNFYYLITSKNKKEL